MSSADGSGRALPPSSAFAGDDGETPAALAAALGLDDRQARLEAVVDALRTERVLVPVVARLDEMAEPGAYGVAGEKSAHTAMVTVAIPDGRAALPVFSSTAAMSAWRSDARPVPVDGRRAALAAGAEADGVLVLDPGGPGAVQVGRPAVAAVALGEAWVPAVRDPRVLTEARAVLGRVPGVVGVAVEPGVGTEVRLVVALDRGVPAGQVRATLRACHATLGTSQVLVDLVDSVSIVPI